MSEHVCVMFLSVCAPTCMCWKQSTGAKLCFQSPLIFPPACFSLLWHFADTLQLRGNNKRGWRPGDVLWPLNPVWCTSQPIISKKCCIMGYFKGNSHLKFSCVLQKSCLPVCFAIFLLLFPFTVSLFYSSLLKPSNSSTLNFPAWLLTTLIREDEHTKA